METENKKLDFPKETPEKAEPSAMEEGDTATPEESANMTETETATEEESAGESAAADEDAETELAITVDDGLKRVPIKNKLGAEIGVFFFRPTDFGMVDRFDYLVGHFGEVRELLDRIPEDEDGNVNMEDPRAMEILQNARNRLFELCDYAFGGNMSEAFFGAMDPFSPVGGSLYCENAIMSVGAFIGKQFDRETAKIARRAEKYLPQDHLKKGGKRRK